MEKRPSLWKRIHNRLAKINQFLDEADGAAMALLTAAVESAGKPAASSHPPSLAAERELRIHLARDYGLDDKTAGRILEKLDQIPEQNYPVDFRYYAPLKQFVVYTANDERKASLDGAPGPYDGQGDVPIRGPGIGFNVASRVQAGRIFTSNLG
jgi:hypothetical protein